jgi:hypothetical protein
MHILELVERCNHPALYFLDEIESLIRRTPEDRREIHQAKFDYGAIRIVQDG